MTHRSPWLRGGDVAHVLPLWQHPRLLSVLLNPYSSDSSSVALTEVSSFFPLLEEFFLT